MYESTKNTNIEQTFVIANNSILATFGGSLEACTTLYSPSSFQINGTLWDVRYGAYVGLDLFLKKYKGKFYSVGAFSNPKPPPHTYSASLYQTLVIQLPLLKPFYTGAY